MWKLCGEKSNPRKTLCGNYVEIKNANFGKSVILTTHGNATNNNHIQQISEHLHHLVLNESF